MSHLDYHGVLERAPDPDSEPRGYVLHLGGFEFDPISYSTLLTLSDCPRSVRRALRECFLERPVLWADLSGELPRHCRESLEELGDLLRALDNQLLVSGTPAEAFYAAIIERWQELTQEVVGGLGERVDSGGIDKLRPVLGEYRREASACVEALVQLLPMADELAEEVREKLQHGRTSLVWAFGVGREGIESAHWSVTSTAPSSEESGFVTWGVP